MSETIALAQPAALRLPVDVRQKCIDWGVPLDCAQCPIALAVAEALYAMPDGWCIAVHVADGDVELTTWDGDYWCRLPAKAQRFIKDFDDRKPVRPFRFTLTRWRVSNLAQTGQRRAS